MTALSPITATILLLDTDRAFLSQVAEALANDGHDVHTVETGEDFQERAEVHRYDLFIIDRMNRTTDGLSLARQARRRTDAGVIVTSCSDDGGDRIVALELGADDVMSKPLNNRELLARVRAVLRRTLGTGRREPLSPAEAALHFHGYRLDPERRIVSDADGRTVPLTDAEFDTLRVFAAKPNRVISREEILTALHGTDHATGGRPVDGLVSRLRAKLYPAADGASRIRTVRGVGYMLVL